MTVEHPVLVLDDVWKKFRMASRGARSKEIWAVRGVSLQLTMGEAVGLVGESGCGKSTLGRIVAGLETATSGVVKVDGREMPDHDGAARVQMVFQNPSGSLDPRMRIASSVAEPLSGRRKNEAIEQVSAALRTVGIPESFMDRHPHEMSGGQIQRVAIARALIASPSLVVLDEPVTALDVSVQAQLLQLLDEISQKSDVTQLFIAHDLAVVQALCTRVLVMYLGEIVEDAPVSVFASRPLHPYSVALRDAVPRPDPSLEQTRERILLRGDVESTRAEVIEDACIFAARCPAVEPVCREVKPPIRDVAEGHRVACHFPGVLTNELPASV